MYTIGTCVGNLPGKFGNRRNLATLADGSIPIVALQQALSELTETYEFEELKYQTPIPPAVALGMTVGQPIVSIASLLATVPGNTAFPQFQDQNVVDITDVYTFWMWFSGGVNQAGRYLEYRRVTTVDSESFGITSSTQGAVGTAPPAVYTRFGSVLQVGPSPDQAYQFFVRVKLRHPVPLNGAQTFTPALLVATLAGGIVTGVTILSGGSGYLPSPTVPLTFSFSPNGSQAIGTIGTNAQGVITGAATIVTGGSGYGTTPPSVATAAVASQVVFMPDSWQPKLEAMACRQIALFEGAEEYVALFENELQTRGVDLQKARESKPQMERDERHNTRQLSLRVSSYTHAR